MTTAIERDGGVSGTIPTWVVPHGRTRERARAWIAGRSLPPVYAAAGATLALTATLALLAMRCALSSGADGPRGWLTRELGEMAGVYAYLGVGGALALSLIGWLLGSRHELLRTSSLTDSLTGIRNRRWFEARLAREIQRVARYPQPLTLLLIDVDHLKQRNDTIGHHAGDRVLRAVAESLDRSCRASDFAARWGGDEFAILATGTRAVEACSLAERVRADLMNRGRRGGHTPTVSIGIADLDGCASHRPEALFRSADGALRRAKSTGRDRVVVAPVPASRSPAQASSPMARNLPRTTAERSNR